MILADLAQLVVTIIGLLFDALAVKIADRLLWLVAAALLLAVLFL